MLPPFLGQAGQVNEAPNHYSQKKQRCNIETVQMIERYFVALAGLLSVAQPLANGIAAVWNTLCNFCVSQHSVEIMLRYACNLARTIGKLLVHLQQAFLTRLLQTSPCQQKLRECILSKVLQAQLQPGICSHILLRAMTVSLGCACASSIWYRFHLFRNAQWRPIGNPPYRCTCCFICKMICISLDTASANTSNPALVACTS